MAIDYLALNQELTTDPNGYGLPALVAAGDLQGAADELNLPRDGTNTGPAIPFRRGNITAGEVVNAIVVTDWPALSGSPNSTALSRERQYLAWLSALTNTDQVRLLNDNGTDAPAWVNLQAMFGSGTGTRQRLLDLATRFGSRGEQLFGQGTTIRAADVEIALQQA